MKRYLLFAGTQYYAEGGWDDLKGSYDTADEAIRQFWIDVSRDAYEVPPYWCHVVDTDTGEKVYSNFNIGDHDGADWPQLPRDEVN